MCRYVTSRNMELLDSLCSKGDMSPESLMLVACWAQNEEVVHHLLEACTTVEATDVKLRTSINDGHENIVRLLLEHGTDVEAVDPYSKMTPL
jgi:hypothetical protein